MADTYPTAGEPLLIEVPNRTRTVFEVWYQPHVRLSEGTGEYLLELHKTAGDALAAAKLKIEEMTKGK